MRPLLLNLALADPPIVTHTRGRVGTTRFRWEFREFVFPFRTTTKEDSEKKIGTSLEGMYVFEGTANRRLAATLHYFHVACRLVAAGNGPWEFMAEAILNLSKVLEVLWGRREGVRAELTKLGYSRREIESDFIPMMVLRDEVDIGHPITSVFSAADLTEIYRYLYFAEERFRTLLSRLVEAVADGTYEFRDPTALHPDGEKQRKVQRLLEKLRTASGVPPT